MNPVKQTLDHLSLLSLCCAGLGLLLMMSLIVSDVIGKYLFNSPIPGVLELVAYYFMTMVVFLPLANVQKTGQHLVIDLFTRSLSGATQRALDAFAALISLVYLSVFIWSSVGQAWHMTQLNQSAQILGYDLMIWPTLWLVPISIVLMAGWVMVQLVENLTGRNGGKKEIKPLSDTVQGSTK